ncbi:hypothetical protein [Gemmata sp.]|uniref:hypothetical protein n=1 Tax=Gemmata sp. TaxID=1914242 RepID=UPI003F710E44
MPVEDQLLTLLLICGWFGLWWLAVRAVFGRYFGPVEWVPIAVLSFAVPVLAADLQATHRIDADFLFWWALVSIAIDSVWAVRRVARWISRRPRTPPRPGGVGLPDRSAGS